MRRTHVILVALLIALSMLSGARLTQAAPAQPYSVTYCDPSSVDAEGNVWQDCYTVTAVSQLQLLPTGDYKYTSNNRVTNTTTRNGVVVFSDTSVYHFTDVFRADAQQISRSYTVTTLRVTDAASGEVRTCAIRANYVVVDGEVRHQTYSNECDL